MADPRPFTNVDPATAAAVRRSGCDPHELDLIMEHLLTYIYTLVPRPPFPDNGRLAALAAPSDGVDRVSRLPDELLRNIVARLPAKGVQDLVLVNRPWPQDVPLPATLFSVSTLTSLYIGLWKLPSTDVLRGASFPHLVKLGICSVEMEHDAIESLVARCPKLEILNIEGRRMELRLRLVSQSLRCVQICGSAKEDIAVVKAPCLERLILSGKVGRGAFSSRVRIGDAPKLHTLGYLEPGQVLEVQGTVIMHGVKPSTSTMLTSVKIVSLNVRFGVRNDVKMVPTLLRCFPNAERLHIVSKRCDQPTGNHFTRSFWEESGPIENVVSRIHTMSLREFIGDPGEVGFLEFFFRTPRALRAAFIIMANPRFTPFSTDEAVDKVRHSFGKMASQSSYQFVLVNKGPAGGFPWNFKTGADFSFHDPFSEAEVSQA